jgi:hypothetical protein
MNVCSSVTVSTPTLLGRLVLQIVSKLLNIPKLTHLKQRIYKILIPKKNNKQFYQNKY